MNSAAPSSPAFVEDYDCLQPSSPAVTILSLEYTVESEKERGSGVVQVASMNNPDWIR